MSQSSYHDSNKTASDESSTDAHPNSQKVPILSHQDEVNQDNPEPRNRFDLDFRWRPSIEHDENFPFSASFHGIEHIYEGRYGTRKILWILLVAATMIACFVFIFIQIAHYSAFHTTTKSTLVYEKQLAFPAVTICNYNSFRRSAVTANDLIHMAYLVKAYRLNQGVVSDFIGEKERQKLINYWKKYDATHAKKFNYQLFVERVGYHASQMIKSCHFRGLKCGPKNFSNVLTSYGNCITFNGPKLESNPKLYQKNPGAHQGLELLINIQEYEYTGSWHSDRPDIGIKFVIHERHYPPDVTSQGKAVGPGSHAYASVKYKTISNLPSPYGHCGSKKLAFYKKYTYAGCQISCKTEYVQKKCGCRAPDMPGQNVIPVCSPQKMIECVSPNLEKLRTINDKVCICPIPCHIVHFDTTISYAKIPNPQMAKDLTEKINKTAFQIETHGLVDPDIDPTLYISQNYILLNVFFDDLYYEKTVSTPVYTFTSLLGNIGGQLGLFVGASVLTLVEIIEFGFYRSRGAIRRSDWKQNLRKSISRSREVTATEEKEPLCSVENGDTQLSK
ncbi:Acid-sensing ion channel 1 [Trichoplax sp. H2]|nr:Acid-sensing ion channel 1 [Trichoplax sp. H2]|eukprot:RDD42240.1 Acid-sensing ion channel 1 [Trichoplax sp. H2]